jgi:hypothetical protein
VLDRLPELYAGIERRPGTFPTQYLGANVPQALAAGSTFHFLQTLLGLCPDAPHDKLYVDPELPEWLPDIELTNVHVGKQRFDLRFRRDGDQTHWDVLTGHKENVIRRPFATQTGLGR